MAKRKAAASSGMKCECGPGSFVWLAISAIIVGIGIWGIVKGYMMQSAGMGFMTVALWYAIGVFIFCFGKCLKKKACSVCFAK